MVSFEAKGKKFLRLLRTKQGSTCTKDLTVVLGEK